MPVTNALVGDKRAGEQLSESCCEKQKMCKNSKCFSWSKKHLDCFLPAAVR